MAKRKKRSSKKTSDGLSPSPLKKSSTSNKRRKTEHNKFISNVTISTSNDNTLLSSSSPIRLVEMNLNCSNEGDDSLLLTPNFIQSKETDSIKEEEMMDRTPSSSMNVVLFHSTSSSSSSSSSIHSSKNMFLMESKKEENTNNQIIPSLPLELWSMILSYLDVRDWLRTSLVIFKILFFFFFLKSNCETFFKKRFPKLGTN